MEMRDEKSESQKFILAEQLICAIAIHDPSPAPHTHTQSHSHLRLVASLKCAQNKMHLFFLLFGNCEASVRTQFIILEREHTIFGPESGLALVFSTLLRFETTAMPERNE